MRHKNKSRRFGRFSQHRQLMFRNMAVSLLTHEVIRTTLPKAKDLRGIVEPLITLARVDTLANRRLVFDQLRCRTTVTKLFTDLGPRFAQRPGGYTRVLKVGFRPGDNAPMAYIELVDRVITEKAVVEDTEAEAAAA